MGRNNLIKKTKKRGQRNIKHSKIKRTKRNIKRSRIQKKRKNFNSLKKSQNKRKRAYSLKIKNKRVSSGGNLTGEFSERYLCEDDDFFNNLDENVDEFYLVRHGKSTANEGQESMKRGNPLGAIKFKGKWDPPLAISGVNESDRKGLNNPNVLDGSNIVVCSSILLRAQQTAFRMFLRNTDKKLYILPNCGEERGGARCNKIIEGQADNCPNSTFWEGLQHNSFNGENKGELVKRIDPKYETRSVEFDPDISYIFEEPENTVGNRWLDANTKVMNPPDKKKFALTINRLFTDLGNIRPIIVTHSHFIMDILRLDRRQKPFNNDIFKFTRVNQPDDTDKYLVERVTTESIITGIDDGEHDEGEHG